MKIEETPDGVVIAASGGSITLSREQAYSVFEWLYSKRDWLRGKDDEPGPQPLARNLRDFTQERYQEFSDEQAERWQALADHIVTGSDVNIYPRKNDP